VSQVTPPCEVLRFIDSQPGLRATCEDYPEYLACYAPQLTLPGFGGPFEEVYEKVLGESMLPTPESDGSGSRPHHVLRREWIALRHSEFESFDAAGIACSFVQGFTVRFGPDPKAFAVIDYIAWFLSSASAWMPQAHRRFLLRGLKEWPVWPWSRGSNDSSEQPFDGVEIAGALFDQMLKTPRRRRAKFQMSAESERDLVTRLEHSVSVLGLPERAQELADRFVAEGFIREWFAQQGRRMAGKNARQGRTKSKAKQRSVTRRS